MQQSKRFFPALEGVRGYAFLAVFLVHFNRISARPSDFWQWPYFLLTGVGWIAVPIFFALSGYLITGILYDTKGRQGYFRVFYGRRSLRVFPLYYLVLLLVAAAAGLRHWYWNAHYFAYLIYVQNFTNSAHIFAIGQYVSLGHLWSLAVEEHFYLLWPVVIWACPDRKMMLRVCAAIVASCFVVRLCWPLFHGSMQAGYWSSFTRADGIVGGAIVALVERGEGLPPRLTRACAWFAAAGLLLLSVETGIAGTSTPMDYFNLVWMTPLANLLSMAVLILLLSKETALSRVCSYSWICSLGRLSYGLYVFHALYLAYFSRVVAPALTPYLGSTMGLVAACALAFSLTWVMAKLSYRFLEEPSMRVKEILVYGPPASRQLAPAGAGWTAVPLWNAMKLFFKRPEGPVMQRRVL